MERRHEVKVLGIPRQVQAHVHVLEGLSAHADQQDLCDWYGGFKARPPVYLVHGEPEPQRALAAALRQRFNTKVHIPKYGETVELATN